MKRLFTYILFLFTALLVSNQLFAGSNKANSHFSASETSYQTFGSSVFEFESSDLKQQFFAQKNIKDKIELSESENETEDSQSIHFTGNFNFSETYLHTHTFGNLSDQVQNGLAPCKYFSYLATIKSYAILYCVYRI